MDYTRPAALISKFGPGNTGETPVETIGVTPMPLATYALRTSTRVSFQC